MRLIICGNGFDLHHGLKIKYSDYRKYLTKNAPYVLERFEKFKWLKTSCKNNLWGNLEETLSIDFHSMIDYYKQYYCDENGRTEYEIDFAEWTRFIYSFTGDEFYKWISSVEMEATKDTDIEHLFSDATCITFNYTDTIERLYGIDCENVLHIHGSLSDVKVNECMDKNVLPFFSSIEEAELYDTPIVESDIWNSDIIRAELQFGACICKEYEMPGIIDSIEDESIRQAFKMLFEKTTKKLYNNKEKLKNFLKYKEINEVVILGHSLSCVDEMYFSLYFVPKYKEEKWVAYVYNSDDKAKKESFFKKYGIKPEYRNW